MSHTLNIQLTLVINFISSKGTNDESLVHPKSDNIEIMVNDAADEVIEESLFEFLLSRSNLPINKDKSSNFISHCVDFLRSNSQKINLNCVGLYIYSLD